MDEARFKPMFAAMFENPAFGAFVCDSEKRFVTVNECLCEMLGYLKSEMLNMTYLEIIHPEDLKQSLDLYEQMIAARRKGYQHEKRYLRKDGSELWVKVTRSIFQSDVDKGKFYSVAIVEDNTETHALRKLGSLSIRQFQMAIDSVGFGMLITNKSLKFVAANQAALQMLGYSTSELFEMNAMDLTYEEDREANFGEAVLFGPGRPLNQVKRYVRKDGTTFWVKVTIAVIPGNEEGTNAIAIFEDLTLQKEAELKIKNQQIQMDHSAKMAALGEIAGGIAHEINTPLGTIKLRATQLSRILSTPLENQTNALEMAKTIESTCTHIGKIVQGLKSFARNSDNDVPVIFEFKKILEDSLILCAQQFEYRGIELRVDSPHADFKVKCRPSQISQVLVNLLNNSADAISLQSQKWISIDFVLTERFHVIKVSDSGDGIPKEVQARLFQPFFTTKEVGVGTGLGLNLSKNIMQAHGGNIQLDSESPYTTFLISMPRTDVV